MAASHVALFAFTGRLLIGVFHTLSEGNAGHGVPGSTVVPDCALAGPGEAATPIAIKLATPSAAHVTAEVRRLDTPIAYPLAPLSVPRL
jgi:hypothetical protein